MPSIKKFNRDRSKLKEVNKMALQAPTTEATSNRPANITDTSMEDTNSSTDVA